jgi:predicted butyrate kinase (DUF1464 family)
MKNLLSTLSCILFLGGCSHQNGFSKFAMEPSQERSANSIQSSKIFKEGVVEGVLSLVYLNEVDPSVYNAHEYFLVAIYNKEKKELSNPNSFLQGALEITLNEKMPIKIKELAKEETIVARLFSQSTWNRYYLVAFEEEKENKLFLSLKGEGVSSQILRYSKNEE